MNSKEDFEMNLQCNSLEFRNSFVAFILLFAILILPYLNSFDCSWHYDDYINIVDNANIRIKNFSWSEIEKSFYSWATMKKTLYGTADAFDTWSRPLAYFSFGVNYYFNGLDVFGYHVVNFAIHYLTAVFLFLFIYNMLQLPLLKERYGSYAYSAALLSTVLWAIHPIQVTAVTYIVQRMASMVSLFYIMAVLFYLKGRTKQPFKRAVLFYFLCFISFLMALGAKQNAVMLPVAIILFDLYFIQGIDRNHVLRTAKIFLFMVVFVLIAALIYVWHDPSTLDYRVRTFSMADRLLTQPRIFFYYISLLLYPLNSRMMLVHDINASTSLFTPWTTFFSLTSLVLLLWFVLWRARKMPLLSYCIIFFFINHLIEGSFLSLELVYEHRNYLPSMLFFLPLVICLLNTFDYFEKRRSIMAVLICAVSMVIIIWGVATVMYNDVFKNEITIWSDSTQKTPGLHTSHHNLALAYVNAGFLPQAYEECQKALQSERLANTTNKYRVYITLAKYYIAVGDINMVKYYTTEALKYFPQKADLHNLEGTILMERNELGLAEKSIRRAISLKPDDAMFHYNLGVVFFKQRHYERAIGQARSALLKDPDYWKAYLLISDAFKAKGNQRLATHFQQVMRRSHLEQSYTRGIENTYR